MEFNDFNKFGYKIFASEISDGLMAMGTDEGQDNAQKFLRKIAANDPLCNMFQIHESNIAKADHPGLYDKTDGLITDQKFTLAVKTADCIPVVFCSKDSEAFGIIHAGRKSITEGILSDSLIRKLKEHSIAPENLRVFFGPHIRKENYDLNPDIFESLKDSKWSRYILPKGGKNYFDMTAAAIGELVKIGVLKENISDCGIDTFEDPRYFSAREDPDNPYIRFLTVIFHEQNSQ